MLVRLTMFSGWTWVAASSLVGVEMFEIIFGSFILAPELLPLVILTLAAIGYFRERGRGVAKEAGTRKRLARAVRRTR